MLEVRFVSWVATYQVCSFANLAENGCKEYFPFFGRIFLDVKHRE